MPFCAALPYRAAVLADETSSAAVTEQFSRDLERISSLRLGSRQFGNKQFILGILCLVLPSNL